MAELVTWACRSPQRLVAVLLTLAIGLLGIGSLALDQLGGHHETTRPVTAYRDTDAALPESKPFVDAAVAFVRLWAQPKPGQSALEWRRALEPLVTRELAAGLALTDPGSLPGGAPTGTPAVRYVSHSSALIAVPLTTGSSVLVTVVDSSAVEAPPPAPEAASSDARRAPVAAAERPTAAARAQVGARPTYSKPSDRTRNPRQARVAAAPVPPTTTASPTTTGSAPASSARPGTGDAAGTDATSTVWKVSNVQPDVGDYGES